MTAKKSTRSRKTSLTDILDSKASDFYSLSVNYLSVNSLDSLEVKSSDGDHTVTVTRETSKDSDDEDAEETTTVSYKLDGVDLDDTTFTTFYNKLNQYDCAAAPYRKNTLRKVIRHIPSYSKIPMAMRQLQSIMSTIQTSMQQLSETKSIWSTR